MRRGKPGMRAIAVRAGGLRRASWFLVLGACLCLALALAPWSALGQTGTPAFAYSGVAEGDVAELLLAPGTARPAALEVTIGEATGAINSAAGIIPDSPGSPEDESEDFALGTATPLRLRTGDTTLAQPFSVQSSAPADAGGRRALLDIDEPPVTLQVTRADTNSQAATDATTAATQNETVIANAVIQNAVTLPAGAVNADVSRAADGGVRSFADSALDAPTTLLADPQTGAALISAQAITASSESTANGTTSANTTDFRILGLTLAGAEGLSIDAVPSPTNPDLVQVTLRLGGQETLVLTLPRGVNLLDPSTFPEGTTGQGGIPLTDILAALQPVLTPLVGAGGPLEGTELIIGGGFSEDGDGTFARGLVEAVRVGVAAGPENRITSIVAGRAFSAADARRAFSNTTNPEVPPGTPPARNPDAAFPGPRQATPAETIFTNPVPAASPPQADREPERDEKEPEEEEKPKEARAAREEPEEDEELPFTGLALAPIAAGGLWLVVGGSLLRMFSGRRRD